MKMDAEHHLYAFFFDLYIFFGEGSLNQLHISVGLLVSIMLLKVLYSFGT